LEELVAAARLGSADQLRFSPADVRAAFWQGRCGIALSWPTAARAAFDGPPPTGSAPAAAAKSVEAGFAALPGSDQAYDAGNRRWDRRTDEEEPSVPLLMTAGRVGSISSRSQQADAALQLLLWLSDDTSSVKVSAVSPATTLFRAAHTKSPQAWVEPQVSAAAAAQYAAAVAGTLGGQQSLAALRIPGRADYLAALDEAVQQAVRGEATPAAALQAVAERWRATTQQLGVDKQRLAYRRCLGLEP
jgi:multiple sugar transport system substrate-binding protein